MLGRGLKNSKKQMEVAFLGPVSEAWKYWAVFSTCGRSG